MFRFLFILVALVIACLAYFWFSAQKLPAWYTPGDDHSSAKYEQVLQKKDALSNKVAQILKGELVLNSKEFGALVYTGLLASKEGREMLKMTEVLHTELRNDELELAAVVDLNKVAKRNAEARKLVSQITSYLPFISEDKVAVSITAKPLVSGGTVILGDDFTIKIGGLPLSADILDRLGAPVAEISKTPLPLSRLKVTSLDIQKDKLTLGVLPHF